MNPSIFNFNEHGVRVALDANGGNQMIQISISTVCSEG